MHAYSLLKLEVNTYLRRNCYDQTEPPNFLSVAVSQSVPCKPQICKRKHQTSC